MLRQIFVVLFLLLHSNLCQANVGIANIAITTDIMYHVTDALSRYSLKNGIKVNIEILTDRQNSNTLLQTQHVLFYGAEEGIRSIKIPTQLSSHKSFVIDGMLLVSHIDNPLLEKIRLLPLADKLFSIAASGFIVVGETDTNYGISCKQILDELGVYQQLQGKILVTSNSKRALEVIVAGRGLGFLPKEFIDAENIIVIDDMEGVDSSMLAHVVYNKEFADLVEYVVTDLIKKQAHSK